ncbi:beta-phosphoglucomutase [Robertkochia solimangrovi]|uniref:beta-phosphoglucomutase n=1 Tax=Robertkochia solimangrovi TaxID=2213046 RepID=UPI00117C403B|nr:beta-phosphoglucomutase [Robertkochia solimangrovi]TRZ43340.1 beta-phosphoglucomutase [Robertkochia solimangrovi]
MKGFIFDLDGVIVDTARYHYLAWKKTGEELGFELSIEQNEKLKGVSRVDSLNKILGWAGVEISEEKFNRLMDEKNEDYLNYVEQMTPADILPGVKDFILELKAKGLPIALGSASKNAPRILEKIGMLEYFDAIADGNSVKKAKPDPEVFLVAAKSIVTAPEACVVFEDAEAGVEAANNAGMISIGIGSPDNLSHADHVFSDFTLITTDFILNLQPKH